MNKSILILSALAFCVSPAFAQEDTTPTQILIDLQDDTDDEDELAIEKLLGGLDIRLNSVHSGDERFFIAEADPSNFESLIDAVEDDDRVEHIEPNYIYKISGVPDDPMWDQQWSFRMVNAPEAWEYAEGKGVIVAVIDTGVAFEDHKGFKRVEDLAGTKFVEGYDFVKDTKHANDDHGHGTHVAGTIAQTTNNGVGVAGLAHAAQIMPLKVLNKHGFGTAADIADAIRFAADEGAKVINMSLGGGPRSFVMESAVKYARSKGVLVACAAGNGGRGKVEFPAAYKGAFAVSSVGPDKTLAGYSSWGKELAISAPGGDKARGGEQGGIIQNTITPGGIDKTNVYLSFQGTSMATPHVAGGAALVMSAGVTDTAKVEQILKDTAEDAGKKGWDERYGAGILNVGGAVKKASEAKSSGWHLAAGLLMLGAFAWRMKKHVPLKKLGILGTVLGAILGSSGLWFLNSFGFGAATIPGVSMLSTGMPNWDLAVLGSSWHFTALWASAIPVFCLATALLGVRKLRGLLIGIAIGWSAHLLISAICPTADVQFIPGSAGLLDRAWLVINAGALMFLASVVAKVEKKRLA